MPTISIWAQNPAENSLDRFTAYYLATVQHVAYSNDSPWKTTLYGILGGTAWHRLGLPGVVAPHAEIALFPGNRALVTLEGTRSFGEFVRQAMGSTLIPALPLPGRVGTYLFFTMSALASAMMGFFSSHPTSEIVLNGHSQGGALAQIMPPWLDFLGGPTTLNLLSCGSPRSADFLFASAQTKPYTRISNAGDPVPALPPSVDPTLDAFLWLLLPPPGGSFRHWGTHFHLFEDGSFLMPPDSSTWSQGQEYLQTVATTQTAWFAGHDVPEYARRLRVQIPVPIGAADPNYPGLQTLDNYWIDQNLIEPAASWSGEFLCE